MNGTFWVINGFGHYFKVEAGDYEFDVLGFENRYNAAVFKSEDEFWTALCKAGDFELDEVQGCEIIVNYDVAYGWCETDCHGTKIVMHENIGIRSTDRIEDMLGEYEL